MTFLPIVARELRVAARRKETHSTRLGVGLGAMVLGLICAVTAANTPGVLFGNVFLQALGWVALGYCVLAGRFLTADCLSREKRDETLGLLFLTDLKGYDVVLGKMAATSLNGLFGLLTVVPMLAMSLLTGGTTLGEILRVALAIFVTFLLSLAIGVFASAIAWEFRSAIAWNFFIMLALTLALPVLAGILLGIATLGNVGNDFLIPCPIYTFLQAFTINYTTQPAEFWSSAIFVFFTALLLLAVASRLVPNSWQVKPKGSAEIRAEQLEAFDPARLFRSRMLSLNPYCWRSARPRDKVDTIWRVMTAITGAALVWVWCMRVAAANVDEIVYITVATLLHIALKLWITLEAGQSFAADLNSGAFELLLPTPLTPDRIVRGQTLALKHLFGGPLILVVGFETLLALMLMAIYPREIGFYFCLWLVGVLVLAADVVTLSLVSMKAALTEKNITRATLKTAGKILILPWLLWIGGMALRAAWDYLNSNPMQIGWGFELASWLVIGLAVDWLYGRAAWGTLSRHFRELVLQRFEPPPKESLRARWAKAARFLREEIWSHPRQRKWALALSSLLAVGLALEIWDSQRSHLPPPEVVLIGPTNRTTLQAVNAGDGAYLVLPDGTLWLWGQIEGASRVPQPVRIDPFRDWKTIYINANRRLGIRQDGTLWEWPLNGNPTQIGHDKDWAQVIGLTAYTAARKTNGTLWEWGEIRTVRRGLPLLTGPPPTAANWLPAPPPKIHRWTAQSDTNFTVVSSAPMSPSGPLALASSPRRTTFAIVARPQFSVDADGTLWVQGTLRFGQRTANGAIYPWITNYTDPIQVCRETNWVGFARLGVPMNSLGQTWNLFVAPPNPAESIQTIGTLLHASVPAQLGTNENWTALADAGDLLLAIRSDGTLWGWGTVLNFAVGSGGMLPGVTQMCLESNWTGFTQIFGSVMAQNSTGELWLPSDGTATGSPSPWTSISAFGRLFATHASTNQHSNPPPFVAPPLTPFEIHSDGTLWIVRFKFGLTTNVTLSYQVDPHTNWVAVTTAGNTSFGLTADGTLWTWGLDLGETPPTGARSRIASSFSQMLATLGARPSANRIFQQKPRPLMKLRPAKPDP